MSTLTLDAEALYSELLAGVRALWRDDMALLGIWSGGAWPAFAAAKVALPAGQRLSLVRDAAGKLDFSLRGSD